VTVTSNLTNLTLAEAADAGNWDDVGGGQGSSQSSDLPIEGLETRARRVDNTTTGFGFDNGAAEDISAAGVHVGFWVIVLQPGQILGTTGLEFSISDSATNCQSGNWDGHSVFAADYIPQGEQGVRVWIDVSRTRDTGSGTLNLANARNFGCVYEMGNVGGNAPNCHLDRIDHTARGLSITAGTVGTPTVFADAITEDITSNKYGIIDNNFINGPVEIGVPGGASATVFNDTNFAFTAGNQPLAAADWQRIDVYLENAGDTIDWGGWFLESVLITVTGTAGAFDMGTGTLLLGPAIVLNSAVTFAGKFATCDQITWGGADLSGTTFEESSAATALLMNTNTDPDGLLDGCSFISDGTGHAIELGANTPSTISFNDHTYSGYAGSDGSTGNEVLYNNSGKAITVNYTGTVPTVRNGAGASTTLVNTVNYTITGLDQNAVVTIVDITTPATPVLLFEETAGVDNTVTYAFDGALIGTAIGVYARNTTIRNQEFDDVLPAADTSFPISQVADTVYI
jgi:hypothetical protein